MFGRILRGRTVLGMAAEQLRLKTGYEAQLDYLGQVSWQIGEGHLLISVVAARNLTGEHGSDGLTGTSFWGRCEAVPEAERMAGLAQIIAWCQLEPRPGLLEL